MMVTDEILKKHSFQKTISSTEAHKRRLDYMRGLVDELEKTKWMYPPLPKELCRSNQ